MGASLAVEALYAAHARRATGELVFTAGSRQSRVLLQSGEVVDAQWGFGGLTLSQCLLASGRVDSIIFDALWARGEGSVVDDAGLESLGVTPEQARRTQVIRSLYRVTQLADGASFEERDVQASASFVPVHSAEILKLLPVGQAIEPDARIRCTDPSIADSWKLGAEDRALLERFQTYSPVEGLSDGDKALLSLLLRDGKAELEPVTDATDWVEVAAENAAAAVPDLSWGAQVPLHESAVPSGSPGESWAPPEGEAAAWPPPELAAQPAAEPEPESPPVEAEATEWPPRNPYDAWASQQAPAEPVQLPNEWAEAPPAEAPKAPTWSYDTAEPVNEMSSAWDDSALPAAELVDDAPPPAAAVPEWEQLQDATVPPPAGVPTADVPIADVPTLEMSTDDVVKDSGAWMHSVGGASWADAIEGAVEVPLAQPPPPAQVEAAPPVPEPAEPAGPWANQFEPLQEESPPPAAAVPPGLKPATRKPRPPVNANPPTPPPDDADLWGLVRGQPGDQAETLEEALQRADGLIEDLMSLQLPGQTTSAPPVAELVEASIEEAEQAWSVDPSAGNATMPADAAWNWDDEDDLAGDPSDSAEAAKLRRQRLLRRAVQNLGGIPQRPSAPSASEPPVPAAPAAAPAPASPPVEARPKDDQAMAERIEKRFEQLKKKPSHFEVLGIDRNATRDQVKAAFLSLAKIFHPDRLPGTLADLAPKMTQVFEAIREAYETLYDDSRRELYTAKLAAKPPEKKAATPAEQAVEAFRRAEGLFKKKDYAGAEAELEAASALDNKAIYLAVRAWVVYTDPARKDATRAKQLMGDALKVDPKCDRAHYQLGVISRVEGDMDNAEKFFREAVRYNPRHAEANQEIRLIEMRRKKK